MATTKKTTLEKLQGAEADIRKKSYSAALTAIGQAKTMVGELGEPAKPTPAPEPTPSPVESAFWTGAKLTDYTVQNTVVGDATEVVDPLDPARKVIRIAVGNSDNLAISGNPRVEMYSPTDLIHADEELCVRYEFYFPSSFAAPAKGGWMIIGEGPYGEPFAGSPPWSIGIFNGDKIGWQRNESEGWDTPWEAPLVRDVWHTLVVRQNFARTGGWVEQWYDGELVIPKLATDTIDATISEGPWAMHTDLYRELNTVKGTDEVLFGPTVIGPTLASVGG